MNKNANKWLLAYSCFFFFLKKLTQYNHHSRSLEKTFGFNLYFHFIHIFAGLVFYTLDTYWIRNFWHIIFFFIVPQMYCMWHSNWNLWMYAVRLLSQSVALWQSDHLRVTPSVRAVRLNKEQTYNSQTWAGRHGRPSGSSSGAWGTLHL